MAQGALLVIGSTGKERNGVEVGEKMSSEREYPYFAVRGLLADEGRDG